MTGSNAPVTGYRRMFIPSQPPLTATKKSTLKPQGTPTNPPAAMTTATAPCPQYQLTTIPVPASYNTASTPSQPIFNLQGRATLPGFQLQPVRGPAQVPYITAQPRGPDFAHGPPQLGFSPAQPYGGAPSHHVAPLGFQSYITDPPASLAPFGGGLSAPVKV